MVMRKQVRRCAMQDCVDKTLGRFCAIGLVLVRRAARGSASLLLCDRGIVDKELQLISHTERQGDNGGPNGRSRRAAVDRFGRLPTQ